MATASQKTPTQEIESDDSLQVLMNIARLADTLAVREGLKSRSLEEEIELWSRAETMVLGSPAKR